MKTVHFSKYLLFVLPATVLFTFASCSKSSNSTPALSKSVNLSIDASQPAQSGTIVLKDLGNNKTQVDISVVPKSGFTGNYPAHIHPPKADGSIDPSPKYLLTNVDASGKSSTVVDAGYADVASSANYVAIHNGNGYITITKLQ